MKNKKTGKLKLTARGRHAVMAMVELAKLEKEGPVSLSKIASTGGISLSYLEQLFAGLRRHGLVRSYRGPGGGYVLARSADQIAVADILISAEDCVPARRAGAESREDEGGNAETQALWSHVSALLEAILRHVSLGDVTGGALGSHQITNKLFETLA
jgi:Rrf2 family iron-sulfur cluster assembly transcriptional regulator